jgi:hypothetical protein
VEFSELSHGDLANKQLAAVHCEATKPMTGS